MIRDVSQHRRFLRRLQTNLRLHQYPLRDAGRRTQDLGREGAAEALRDAGRRTPDAGREGEA